MKHDSTVRKTAKRDKSSKVNMKFLQQKFNITSPYISQVKNIINIIDNNEIKPVLTVEKLENLLLFLKFLVSDSFFSKRVIPNWF
jgi:hypothetical protein